VVTVAPSGANFTSMSAALASITDASATKRYEIRVGAGVYVEPQGIKLKNYVDNVGSGAARTTISSPLLDGYEGTVFASGTVNADVRDLTILNTGGTITDLGPPLPAAIAVRVVTSGGQVRLSNMVVRAEAAGAALVSGVFVSSGALTIEDSPVYAGNVTNRDFGDSSGVWVQAGDVTLRGVDVDAGNIAVWGAGTTSVRVLSSTLTGRNGGFATCGLVQLAGVIATGAMDVGAVCAGVIRNGAAVNASCT